MVAIRFMVDLAIDIPKKIETILNQRMKDEHIDKVSVLKQMVREGAGSYLVDQYSNSRNIPFIQMIMKVLIRLLVMEKLTNDWIML